ncbi:phosphate ABC transporter substrate-binding protein PstS [Solirubrobacter sp. CPCC 204708]|uniref:Phosphate-binding protein n=1 Tax=Solirubrobacter deserti TaxID=2282478 RepID=A0ABT4RTR4_9ACTN|nr:phosphate ABC transporter substrate-binding protein PstS [Solirubrobacter deserti]MBE2320020.1 phosphate ABC transporter substrate-binding protein PstS [Solirubrobacter deserti]MDA0141964.1 phosphate ABC transporter substrate-binding protein PstS [Solirubrobacter deserti]
MISKRFMPACVAFAAALTLAACGASNEEEPTNTPAAGGESTPAAEELEGNIAGAGASSQEAAMQAWIAGFGEANPGATISYDPVGSGGGREQFVAGGTAFGGTDAHLADEELTGAQERCGGPDNLIEIPAYISPIAVIYNLEGVDNLQLSPETVAKIFKQEIKTWDDAAIKADNPDAQLPSDRITVVNRADESGTTENFVEYLAAVAPDVWDFEISGDWPVKGGEAAQGTSGVVDAVKAGAGAIGYADASQAGELGTASIKVGEEFVGPTPEAAAKIVEASQETDDPGAHVFTYDLNRETTEAGTYPIVLVSYIMACTQYDDAAQGALVKGFINYIISPEGQEAAASNAGSAPISDAVRQKVQPAVDAIAAS